MSERDTTVRSVERAIQILHSFGQNERTLSLGEISRRVHLPKSTTHRLISALEKEGFLIQDEITSEYQLGFAIIYIADIALKNLDLPKVAQSIMEHVAQTTGQTCNLYVRRDDERVCIAQVSGPNYIRRHSYMGATLPLYCGASGKVILAYCDLEFQNGYFERNKLDKLAENTITSKEVLINEFSVIKEKGHSFSFSERDELTASVAVPIFDHTGEIAAALTVSGANVFFTQDQVDKFSIVLKSAASEVSKKLGYIS